MSKIVTYTGKTIDLMDPDPALICIEDIAHHLSMINRFTGATVRPYSVAAHSVYVSRLLESTRPELAFEGLMHDATEAYLGDVSSPLKSCLPDYRRMENLMHLRIAERFGLPGKMTADVKWADHSAYVKERPELLPGHPMHTDPDWEDHLDIPVPDLELDQVSWPKRDEALFIERFNELTGAAVIHDEVLFG